MQLTVTGIFREHNTKIRNFHRTLIIVPSASGGLCIKNEMLTINHATADQIKTAFKSSTESSPSPPASTYVPLAMEDASPKAAVEPQPSMEIVEGKCSTSTTIASMAVATKMEMIQMMAQRSKMNLEWSEK